MADALGWIGVPIVPTFSGVGKKLSEELVKPAQKAGQAASGEIKKSNKEVVDSLDRQVKASSGKLKKFENDYSDAMSKRESQQHKVNAAMEEQTVAEEKYQAALKKGGSAASEKAKLERATAKVVDETLKHEKAERDVIKAEESHAKQLEDLQKTTERYEEAQKNLGDELDDSSSSLDGLRDKFAGLGDSMKDGLNKISTGAFLGIGAKIGTALMSGVQEVVSEGWDTAMSIDQVSRSLGAMTSETEVAEQMMVDLRKVASDKPVDYTAFLGAANTLAYMGYEGDEAVKVLDNIATAATGAGNDGSEALESAADALGKMQSNGKVTMDEIGTISSQGVPMLDMLIEHFGMTAGSYEELQEKISSGGVELEDVFQALGGTGADSFQMLSDSADNMNQSLGSQMQILKDNLNVSVGEALQPVLEELDFEEISESIGDIAEKLIELLPLVIDIGMWVVDNIHWIAPLAGVLAGIAGAIWLVNLAMAANPVVLIVAGIVAAIAGLVAALTWFFTQTEVGQEIWATFTEALGVAWDWVVEKLSEGWEWLRDNVFDPLWTFVQETVWPALQTVFGLIIDYWTFLYNTFLSVWGWLRDNVFVPLASFVTETLWPALQTAFEWIGNAWQGLSDGLSAVWSWIRENVFQAFMNKIAEVKDWFSARIEDIKRIWQGLSDRLSAVWSWINDNVFNAFRNAIAAVKDWFSARIEDMKNVWQGLSDRLSAIWSWINDNVFQAFRNAIAAVKDWFSNRIEDIKNIWQGMADKLGSVWNWINENVFDALGRGIDRVKGWFESGVEGIRKAWDMLKEAAAKPVRFVVNQVWNEGLLKAVNAVTGFIGMDPVEKVNIGFARGGILPGFSRMRDGDDQLVPMRRGEGVLVSEGLTDPMSRKLFLDANENAKKGTSFAEYLANYANGYAGGGIIGSMQSVMRHFYPELSLTSGLRPGDSGYHGTGQAADFSNTGAGMPSTPAMQAAAAFWYENYGDQLEQLIHHPARNIGSGMDVGDGFGYYGSGTMYGHTDHIHLAALRPIVDPSGVVQMVPYDGSGGGGFDPLSVVKSAWDAVVNAINPFDDESEGNWFSQIPGAFLSSAGDKLWEFVTGKVGSGSYEGTGGISGDVESWREMAMAAMRRNGFNADDPAQVNAMLRQIQSESSGNPRAVQGIIDVNSGGNEAVGLLQVIPGTFAANRDPSLPDDRMDPWANMNAALRYYRGRYGGDLTTMWGHGHGYAEGGIVDSRLMNIFDTGGVLRDGRAALNLSGADEIIINDDQLQALNKLANNVGALVNHLVKTGDFNAFAEAMSDEFRPYIEKVQDTLTKMADPRSEEGITTRQITRRVLGLGINIPGGEIIGGLLDAEVELMNSRARHVGHLEDIAEAQAKYDEALAAHQELLGTSPEGITESDQKKLDDAQQAVDDAEDAEARAKAEQELAKIREELEKSSLESAENWAAGIEKANTDVLAAGENLAKAREAQVQDLDHIIVLSQENVEGLIPEARKLADQLLSMGAPANLVSQGLNAIVGSLMGISGVVGPAGISLGMAFDLLKVAMSLFDLIRRVITEFIGKIRDARMAARTTLADFMGALYDMAEKTAEYQHLAATRTQELNRLNNDIRVSSFELAKEVRDGFRAIGQAERNMFKERAKLDEMFENSYIAQQLRARGLLEDISSALTFRFDEANRETLEMTDEMWAQYWRYEASRAQVEKTKLQSELNLLQAQFALEDARMTSLRWQEDVNRQLARSAEMLARANGVDLEGAALGTMFADTLVDLAELQKEWDSNWFKRMFNADYRAGMTAEMNYLKGELAEIASVADMNLTSGDIDRLLKKMSTAAFWDLDPMAVLRGASPEIAEALRAADSYNRWEPYYDAQDQQEERDREVEDLQNLLDRFEATFGLEEQIAGYDSIAEAFDRLADSYSEDLTAAERESLREEFRREMEWASQNSSARPPLDDDYADVRRQAPSTVQVVVEGGKLYSEDDVIDIVNGALEASGLDTKAEKVTASQVAASRRTVKA